jgi:hypothetical protein
MIDKIIAIASKRVSFCIDDLPFKEDKLIDENASSA